MYQRLKKKINTPSRNMYMLCYILTILLITQWQTIEVTAWGRMEMYTCLIFSNEQVHNLDIDNTILKILPAHICTAKSCHSNWLPLYILPIASISDKVLLCSSYFMYSIPYSTTFYAIYKLGVLCAMHSILRMHVKSYTNKWCAFST